MKLRHSPLKLALLITFLALAVYGGVVLFRNGKLTFSRIHDGAELVLSASLVWVTWELAQATLRYTKATERLLSPVIRLSLGVRWAVTGKSEELPFPVLRIANVGPGTALDLNFTIYYQSDTQLETQPSHLPRWPKISLPFLRCGGHYDLLLIRDDLAKGRPAGKHPLSPEFSCISGIFHIDGKCQDVMGNEVRIKDAFNASEFHQVLGIGLPDSLEKLWENPIIRQQFFYHGGFESLLSRLAVQYRSDKFKQ